MKCENARELFSSYWENTIESPLRVAFEQHLAQCQRCSAEYDRFHATVMMIEELPEVEAPPDFHASVMARVEAIRRAAPRRVRWWDLDWQKVFTIRVPARAAAMGFAVLLMMAILIRLAPLNYIAANFIGISSTSDQKKVGDPDAPKGPLPWSPNPEVRYGRGGSGLSISVTPTYGSDQSSAYVLRFGTDSRDPVEFMIRESGSGNKTYSGTLTRDRASTCPIAVAPSGGGRRSETAKLVWQYNRQDYVEYIFLPSEFDPGASKKRLSLPMQGISVYNVLRGISAEYGVVVLASGDLDQQAAPTEMATAQPEAVLTTALTQTGLRWYPLSASIYIVESAR